MRLEGPGNPMVGVWAGRNAYACDQVWARNGPERRQVLEIQHEIVTRVKPQGCKDAECDRKQAA